MAVCCANPGTPSGGPRDLRPPVLVSSKPEPNATGYNGDMVTLVFNENIQVKDIDSKFIVSPPMAVKPKVDAHGNTIRIRFDSDTLLLPATTYTFDFADCVSDLNEGNVLENFTFSFSTGESNDSMMISGNVYDATDIKPVKGIYVMLQTNLSDTALSSVPPIRIAKTDEYGRFAIKNVPDNRQYRIYALDDQNRNFIFDQPVEKLAWLDGTVRPAYEIRQIDDSVRIDSLSLSADTAEWVFEKIKRDTLVYTPDSLTLFAFSEDVYEQYITSEKRDKRNRIDITFNKPMPRRPKITFPGQDSTKQLSVNELSAGYDTCIVWITDSTLYKGDSVIVAINYPVLDSLKQLIDRTDTLDFWFYEKKQSDADKRRNRRQKDKTEEKKPTLQIAVPSSLGAFANLSISTEAPFKTFNVSGLHLTQRIDTIYKPMDFTIIDDTVNLRRKALKAPWTAGSDYRLVIDSAAVTDIYDLVCDSLCFTFKTNSAEKYGTLYVNVDSVPQNGLLQLMNSRGNEVVRQVYLPDNGKAAFRYIKPGEYMLRILTDANRNGRWDNGKYAEMRQPESLIYYMERISVRANWDIKVDFETCKYSPDRYARKFIVKPKKKNSNGR